VTHVKSNLHEFCTCKIDFTYIRYYLAAKIDFTVFPILAAPDPIEARTIEAPQSGCFPIKTRTVESRKAAMLAVSSPTAVPSPTARVQLLGQLNCDWVTQCCVRKEETPDHCTFGLDSSSRQTMYPSCSF
jgi:hypothetical protein